MRTIVVFEKKEEVCYISHLELMRCFHRALRRTNLPVKYSKGFNPHIKLAFSPPLSVGLIGNNELMDLDLSENVDFDIIIAELNKALPKGIRIKKCKQILENEKSFMALTLASKYNICFKHTKPLALSEILINFLDQKEIFVYKRKSENRQDIRQMIFSCEARCSDIYEIECIISASGAMSLHINDFLKAFIEYSRIEYNELIDLNIFRNDLMSYNKDGVLIPVYDLV